MKGAFNLFNRGPKGGITGFQAGFIGWQVVEDFMGVKKGAPLRVFDYSDMLYPQYADRYDKVISSKTWSYLKKEAAKNLEEVSNAHPKVISHWRSITEGIVPFGYKVNEP